MNNTSESEACKNARAEAMAVLCDKCRGEFDRRLREAEPAFHYIEDYIWHALCPDCKNRMLDFSEQEMEQDERRDVRG